MLFFKFNYGDQSALINFEHISNFEIKSSHIGGGRVAYYLMLIFSLKHDDIIYKDTYLSKYASLEDAVAALDEITEMIKAQEGKNIGIVEWTYSSFDD